ncbi:ATP-binding cassette domain-containing protein [Pseudahrensia aquimaris]|uniref:ATP-binding cassette domain-containing protein n=1 Tax=Pseudahrensia aquimaris TaxID=744461 RepID=A0ABW3FKM5_9HYPH
MKIPNASPLVSLTNAGHRAGDKWLVRGVSFNVAPGEIVTLIGPNGSGKTTTMRMAIGLLDASEGKADRVDDLRVGYVPQKIAIDWTMPLTVQRFMALTGKASKEQINDALHKTGAQNLCDAQIRDLSGGEFQRVQLARAIVRKADLLVLDEPVQGVDFAGEIALYELIGALRDDLGCGVLLISHDLHLVMGATDKVICLNGHMCCHGTPQMVSESAAYRDLFGARAAGALAVYQHEHDHTHLPDGRVQHADGTITDHCHPDDGHHHDHGEGKHHAG